VVLIRGNRLMTANVGDSRAVVSIGGKPLDVIEEQTPGRKDERARIEQNGGWVREERELHMSKLHSMDLSDPEIQQKAERVVQWVNIYRVNGELAVSRAIGDIDYKGEALAKYEYWAFPDGHDRVFHGDLIISHPEYVVRALYSRCHRPACFTALITLLAAQEMEITPEFEFLILACDGLWDTITSREAVRHVGAKLREGYTAKVHGRLHGGVDDVDGALTCSFVDAMDAASEPLAREPGHSVGLVRQRVSGHRVVPCSVRFGRRVASEAGC